MNPLAPDLDHVLEHTSGVWHELRSARVFVTGGTGFFGCWLLETWAWAWEHCIPNASMTVLTRSAEAFRRKAPHLADHPAIRLVEGDVRSFSLPDEAFTHVIHAASDAGDPVLINPGAWSHTSVALRDALAGLNAPMVEVHITNIHAREEFRHFSYVSGVADGVIAGLGVQGYVLALQWLAAR